VRVQVGDARLFFEVAGTKLVPDGPAMRERPTLLVLHGGPGNDHSVFRPVLDELADVAQVVYLDHRGHGRSDRSTPDRWNLDTWADDVRGFCEALDIAHPVVYGNSFGGIVALAHAIRHPGHPGKLILVSTLHRPDLEPVFAAFERLGGREARAAAERAHEDPTEENTGDFIRICGPLITREPPDPDQRARRLANPELAEYFDRGEGRTFDFSGGLGAIRCPVLVVAGELDPVTPPSCSEAIAAELGPQLVRYELVRNAGHGILRDEPEALLALVRSFL
jgi:pimeloyl-ACP methyl ester carboxylesterase